MTTPDVKSAPVPTGDHPAVRAAEQLVATRAAGDALYVALFPFRCDQKDCASDICKALDTWQAIRG